MLLRPCILQYVLNFPGSRRSSRRPLVAAQTVYFTVHCQVSRVSEELPETALFVRRLYLSWRMSKKGGRGGISDYNLALTGGEQF